jgi:hypothetical protein
MDDLATTYGRTRAPRLRAADLPMLAEALLALAVSSAAVRLLHFKQVAKLATLERHRSGGERRLDRAARVGWAVQAWARRVPWKAVCFQIGLATHFMLRRRGVPSVLHYGVGRDEDQELAAHVWISVDREVVVGAFEHGRFHEVLALPPAGPAPAGSVGPPAGLG